MGKTTKAAVPKEEKEKGPKRPQSAYLYFVAEERKKIKTELPEIKSKDVLKEISERWAKATDADKEKFEALAAEDQKRYESEGGKPSKAAKKAAGGPKKPSSAYIFFCNDQRETIKAANPGLAAKEILVELGQEWKKLSKDEKKKYDEMAAGDKKRYESEGGGKKTA